MIENIVCKISDVAEASSKIVEIKNNSIAIFHINGQFFALENKCPLDGADLGKGFYDGRGENITCPFRGHIYNLKTGKSPFSDGDLKTFEIRIKNGNIVLFL